MPTLGFLGLGTMGSAMARRLVEAGHDVIVWNRSDGPAAELASAGARVAASPAEALSADVSFSMLANDQAVAEVLSSENLGAVAGRIHVSMASLSPGAVDELDERVAAAGGRLVAAPVLGRPQVAASGKLNILAAGPQDAIDEIAELLLVMGQRVWPMGAVPRRAAVVKIAVNYNIIHAIQSLGESIALVEAAGIEADAFVDLLSNTLFGGVAHSGYGVEIATRAYRPAGFSMALGRKDLTLAEGLAAEAGFELPTAGVLHELFDAAVADPELTDADWGALAELTRRRVPKA